MQDEKTISGSIVHITDGAEADAREIIVEIEPVQSGSGTPSPSNVRPISGWNDVSVYRGGHNYVEDLEVGGIDTDGSDSADSAAKRTPYIPVTEGEKVICEWKNEAAGYRYSRIALYDASKAFVSFAYNTVIGAGQSHTEVVTIPSGVAYLRFCSFNCPPQIVYKVIDNLDVTLVPFGSTVYGGTIDLVSGVLTVDRAYIDLGSLDWQHRSEVKAGLFSNVSFSNYKHSTDLRCICENYDYKGTVESVAGMLSKQNGQLCFYFNSVYPNNSGLYIIDNRFTSKDDFKTAVTGVKLVYELATPTTAQLTGQQIELLRDCYVWSDVGDITLTYETELLDGRFHKIKVNDNSIIAPNNFELEREDVYTAEYTTCTGKLIADKIGWKYADTTMQWDTLPDDMLAILTGTTGAFTLKFTDSDGSHTENVIRLGVRNTATRFTDDFGNALWRNIELEVSFTNVH